MSSALPESSDPAADLAGSGAGTKRDIHSAVSSDHPADDGASNETAERSKRAKVTSGKIKENDENITEQAIYMDDTNQQLPIMKSQKKSTAKPAKAVKTTPSGKKNTTLTSFFQKDPAAKPKSASAAVSEETMALLQLEKNTMGSDWFDTFLPEMRKDYFLKIKQMLTKELATATVYPSLEEIYTFTKYPLADIRVVILGQDPYHGPGQAHVKKGVSVPPSLVNIYKEIKAEFGEEFTIPKHGFLEGWSKQGVLLLNATLTVREHEAGSHASWGWATFTDSIIQSVSSKHAGGVVFMLWGGHARKKKKLIDSKRHLVLESAHPSPLSAHQGFLGNGHFRKANEYLEQHGKAAVQWGDLP
ncbi:uracil DNA glycosylase [Entophlyctis luteolus]|nr:uracil DNA glycosylase [Entophlyctis luteolus]